MSTYIASLYMSRSLSMVGPFQVGSTRRREYQTYPPGPLTNTIFAVLPGPCQGQYVFSREAGFFVANGNWPRSSWLTEQLNVPGITQHLGQVMARDIDIVGNATIRRQYFLHTQDPKRPLGPERGTDPYFLPTLFENDPLNYRHWPGYRQQPTRRVRSSLTPTHRVESATATMRNFDPAKYFAVVLLPFRSRTLVVATWPVISTFSPHGEILGADAGMPHLGHFLGHLRQILSDPRSQSGSPAAELDYWSLANHVTVFAGSKTKQFNFAIPPLEWALAALPPATHDNRS